MKKCTKCGRSIRSKNQELCCFCRPNNQKYLSNTCIQCGKPCHYLSKYCYECSRKIAGEKAAHWKGGKITDKGGYTLIRMPGHPRANQGGRKYVLEHIVVWETANKKELPPGWVIHHLNGIKSDNRIVNLIALPDRKHKFILEAKAKRIQELEALLRNQGHLL